MQDTEQRMLANSLFELLSGDEWDALRAQMEQRSFNRGDVLVEQGTIAPAFQIITQGTASVVATSQHGQRHELGHIGAGQCIGEMSLLTGDPASADVIAATAVTTYSATQARLSNLGDLRARLIEALSSILAGRLKNANERLLSLHPAKVHIVCCTAHDMHALSGLPAALSRTTGTRTLLLLSGEKMAEAARSELVEDRLVTVLPLQVDERVDLRPMMQRLSSDYADVVIFGEQSSIPPIATETMSHLHVVAANSAPSTASGHGDDVELVVIGEQRGSQPALKQLTDRFGSRVVAILPGAAALNAANSPISRLARRMSHRQVGVALGAGSSKGLAHLGALRALNDLGVGIDVISGCSIGSAIAAGWASGLDVEELTEAVRRVAARAIRPTLPLRSFLSSKGIRDELVRVAGDRRLEDLDIPVSLVATDLYRRTDVTFTSGRAWPRILASMALPGLYPPVAAMGSYLVDGGVLNPVPVRQCRDLGAGIVIGVRLTGQHTSPREDLDFAPTRPYAIETISRSMEIMHNRISEMSNVQADVTIEACIEGGGMRDFQKGGPIVEEGYRAVMGAAGSLRSVMPYVMEGAA